MPLNGVNTAGALVKAFMNGIAQTFAPKEKETQNTRGAIQAPEAPTSRAETPDALSLSSQGAVAEHTQILESLTGTHEDRTSPPQAKPTAHQNGAAPVPGQEAEAASSAQYGAEAGVTAEEAQVFPPGQNGASGFEKMLQTYLQSDPRTLAGLENFMRVEFSHFSADPQTFQTLQLMTMLKQARQLLEEQKLRNSAGEQESVTASEEAERALLGASLMGYAYSVLRRKKLRGEIDAGVESRFEEDFGEAGLSQCLDDVLKYLKKAQEGLERALIEGANHQRLRVIIHRVIDLCADIAQMRREMHDSQRISA